MNNSTFLVLIICILCGESFYNVSPNSIEFCYIGWRYIDDGDCVSCKACWTKEANEDAERYINSNAYVLSSTGDTMRSMSQGFVMTQYLMTMLDKDSPVNVNCNNNTRSKYYIV